MHITRLTFQYQNFVGGHPAIPVWERPAFQGNLLTMDMLRILIADDHPAVRRSLRSLVQTHADWDVCGEAFDGLDAVEKAKVLRPDIVLLDISMPNMSGIEATPLIHQAVPQSGILIVSQHDSPEINRLVTEAGAQGYIPKSQVWSQLLPAIESARRKQHRRDSSANE